MSAGDKVTLVQYRTLRPVQAEEGATYGGTLGLNLFKEPGVLLKLSDFASTAPAASGINTTDDVEEGQWNLWFTNLRAQNAVGGILADTATIDLAYVGGTSITATLKDLADSGTGAALVKITRDAKGRVSGTDAATTTDLAEGSNLYYTDARADARITLQKAQPLGLATLDAGGKLDAGQLPALAITETFVVASQAAMLVLTAQEGDVAVRTDLSQSFILTTAPASTLANWQELLTPASPVTSVFGRVGSVTAASGDYTFAQIAGTPTTLAGYGITDAQAFITAGTSVQYWRGDKTWQTLDKSAVGLGNADNTSDVNKPVSMAQAASIATKEPIIVAGTTAQFWRGDKSWSSTLQGSLTFEGAILNNNFQPLALTTFPNSQSLMGIAAYGANGSAVTIGGTVNFRAGETWTGTANGTDFAIRLVTNGTTTLTERFRIKGTGDVVPGSDNAQTCGSASLRWSVVYAGTGTINTSDAREKTDVEPLSYAELAAATDLSRAPGTYQWLSAVQAKGADARLHAGLTVQRAIEIMQAHGLDPMRYGFICYDQWDELPEIVNSWPAQDAVLDESGNVITQAVESGSEITQVYRAAGDRYSFRHDELMLFIARGFAARLDALEAK